MAKFVSVFISASHRRIIVALIWALMFFLITVLIGVFATRQVKDMMRAETERTLEQFIRLGDNVRSTFAALHKDVTAEPCSPAFISQLRKVAFIPDGLNEFLYAPGGVALCSISVPRFAEPVRLGKPDIATAGPKGTAVWLDRDLGFLGLDGLRGAIALQEPFAAVIPRQKIGAAFHSWMDLQSVLVTADGNWRHRSGTAGIYESHEAWIASGSWLPVHGGAFHYRVCDPAGLHCIGAKAQLADILSHEKKRLVTALLGAALLAAWLAGQANRAILSYWSLDARFRRHLGAQSIVLAYQPIMHLESGEISGCEVLARWRDIDDSILYPDKFIGIVERYDLTRRFTQLVVERAFEELSALPAGKPLQVNFNIFPRDLDCAVLRETFSVFDQAPGRFEVILEIVESDAICVEHAPRQIEALRADGIKIYIDDFGTGYSNVANLAVLPVDGVKLDRAFAMAPDGSLTAQMLSHAIEMIRTTGRTMVIEGIETAERLAQLRASAAPTDHAQGYFISRPLAIDRLAAFLATHKPQQAAAVRKPSAPERTDRSHDFAKEVA